MEQKRKERGLADLTDGLDRLHKRGHNGYALHIPMLINVMKGRPLQAKYSFEEGWGFFASSMGAGVAVRVLAGIIELAGAPQVTHAIERYHVDNVPLGVGVAAFTAAVSIDALRKLKR